MLQALVQESTALLDLARGRFREALAGLEQARRIYAELDMPQQLAIVERRVAETYIELRLLPEALAGFDAALRRFESLGMDVDRAWALLQQGRALALAGNHAASMSALRLGEALFEKQGNVQGLAAVRLARAELALAGGRGDDALRLARLAAQDFGKAGLVAPRLRAQSVQARALLHLQDPAAARQAFDAVLEQARSHDLVPTQLHGLAGRAMAARALGDVASARQDLEAAAALFEDIGGTLPDDGIRSAYQSDHLAVFLELLRLALDAFEQNENQESAASVMVQLERFRARALADRLASGGLDRADAGGASATAGAGGGSGEGAEARLSWLHRRFQRLRDDAEASSNLEAQIRATERELLAHARSLRLSAAPRLQAVDAPLDTQALQSLLQNGDALVEYGVLDDELLAIVVTPGAVIVRRRLASWRRVREVVRWTRFQFEAPRYGAAAAQRHAASLQQRVNQRLDELHGLIWAPLESVLSTTLRVIVVPHAQLGAVPFAALRDGRDSLVDRHEIAVVPSARIALRGLERPPRRVKSVLALGESSRLPHAQHEVQTVCAMLPEGRACVDADATIDALRRLGERFDVIHLACHAQFRADNPMFSAVHLHDGPLSAHAIESMSLRSALVVLSACETALHAEDGGDEIFGITRAFLVAGAERVVASLCAVDDAAAARTMIAFYGALNRGASAGAAMREAQLAVRELEAHPYYWASFALVGGW